MKNLARFTSFVFTALMVLNLSACGNKSSTSPSPDPSGPQYYIAPAMMANGQPFAMYHRPSDKAVYAPNVTLVPNHLQFLWVTPGDKDPNNFQVQIDIVDAALSWDAQKQVTTCTVSLANLPVDREIRISIADYTLYSPNDPESGLQGHQLIIGGKSIPYDASRTKAKYEFGHFQVDVTGNVY